MRISYTYTSYEESTLATFISRLGGIFSAFGKLGVLTILVQLGEKFLKSEETNFNSVTTIVTTIVVTIVMFIIRIICNKVSRNIALKEFNRRLSLSLDEIENLLQKKPRLKKWFIKNHPEYIEAHKDEIINDEKNNLNKKVSKKRIIVALCLVVIMVAGIGIFTFNQSKKHENDTTSNDKYQCYVELNNEVVSCLEYSVEPYLKDKGSDEQVKHIHDENTVQMNPIVTTRYDILKKVKKISKVNPKLEVDDEAEKLAESTEKLYDLIDEIHYVYGGKEYGKKTEKSKQELHKELVLGIDGYNDTYKKFSVKMDKISIGFMAKNLEEYKKNKDMDSYHTLNVMLKAEKLYEYMVENNITNDNLFDMNLDEYTKRLEEYNKAFEEFKKQNIKGSSIHTKSYVELMNAYHNLANNVVNMVKQKNLHPEKVVESKGIVKSSKEEDIQDRLYYYVDRLISSYNSIQLFKK